MTERIAVNFGHMQHGASQLQATMNVIIGMIEESRAQLADLRNTWQAEGNSQAAAQFEASQQKLERYINDMAAVIGRLGTATADASDYQQSVERKIRDSFVG